MTLISYRGELAAIAGPRRLLFAHHIERGRRRGPYTDAAAEAFARDRLMPEHAFHQAATGRTAAQLAATFNVPLEQARHRRAELSQPPRYRQPARRPQSRRKPGARRRTR